jgi:hypothetical protein
LLATAVIEYEPAGTLDQVMLNGLEDAVPISVSFAAVVDW